MSLPTMTVGPFDPNNFSGAPRSESGVVRMGAVTPGQPYSNNGSAEFARWLYIGSTGSVSIICWDGTSQTLTNIAVGIWHPVFTIGVNQSGTTATGILWGS